MLAALAAGLLVAPSPAAAQFPIGSLTLPEPVGCVRESSDTVACIDGRQLSAPSAVAISADGTSLYATSPGDNAIAHFERDAVGALRQPAGAAGCIRESGADGCAIAEGMSGVRALAVAPDGRNVYAVTSSTGTGAVLTFQRSTAPESPGVLSYPGRPTACIAEEETFGACRLGQALAGASAVAVSPDSKHVYVTGEGYDSVAAFARDPATGLLRPIYETSPGNRGCAAEQVVPGTCDPAKGIKDPRAIAISPEGKHLYVAGAGGDSVAAFTRNAVTGALTQLREKKGALHCISEFGAGGCRSGRGLYAPASLVVSPNGRNVYVGSSTKNDVAILTRNPLNGRLSQSKQSDACVSETGTGGECTNVENVAGVRALTMSRNGKSLYVAAAVSKAITTFSVSLSSGKLSKTSRPFGCISESGEGNCMPARGMLGPSSLVLDPQDNRLYTAATDSNAVAVFRRRKAGAGPLDQLAIGCHSRTPRGGYCTHLARSLDGAVGAAIAPDGRHLYVSARNAAAISAFALGATPTGFPSLEPIHCLSNLGSSVGCGAARALTQVQGMAISPDGRHVYAASPDQNAVAVFARNAQNGRLTQLAGTAGCVSHAGGECAAGRVLRGAAGVAVSSDGKHVYVASVQSGAIASFSRNQTTGALSQGAGGNGCIGGGPDDGCREARALAEPLALALDPAGQNLYVAASRSDAVAAFARDPATGALTQLAADTGCVSETGRSPSGATGYCGDGRALRIPTGVAVAPDGASVYVSSFGSRAVAVLSRGEGGRLTQLAGDAGCIAQTTAAGCRRGGGMEAMSAVAVSPDSLNVYATSSPGSALAIFARETAAGATQGALSQGIVAGGPTSSACFTLAAIVSCRSWTALGGPNGIALAPNGSAVFVTSVGSDALTAFRRTQG